MSKLDKRAISTILVIAILALSFVLPLVTVSAGVIILDDFNPVPDAQYQVGATIVVKGDEVTSGAIVNLYWDYVTTAGLMNNTVGEPDTTFEVSLDVPDCIAGWHYVWVKDMETSFTDSVRVEVIPKIKTSVTSGLEDDPVTVTGTGFAKESDVGIYFGTDTGGADSEPFTGDGTKKTFTLITVPPNSIVTGITSVTVGLSQGEAVWTTGAGTTTTATTITVTAPTTTADFTAGLYDSTGATEHVAPISSTGDDVTADTVNLFYALLTDLTDYMVKITVTDEAGSYVLSDDGDPAGSGGPITTGGLILPTEYTLNYVTGAVTLDAAPATGVVIVIAYDYMSHKLEVTRGTPKTDDVGTVSTTFLVPVLGTGSGVTAYDGKGNSDYVDFTIGAGITLTPDEGPSGVIVTIKGRGFDRAAGETEIITVTVDSLTAYTKDKLPVVLAAGVNTFTEQWVIPTTTGEGKKDLVVTGTPQVDTPHVVTATFEVTGLTAIKLTPGFGPPGGSVEIEGYNFTQISGTVVTLDFGAATGGVPGYATYETDSKGEFSDTIRIPAIDYMLHELEAVDEFGLTATKDFRIGIMIIILNPSYGPTGSVVSLTGIGFTAGGTWNASMDGFAITDEAVAIDPLEETISETIIIPTVPVRTYEITVLDIESEIDLYEVFFVTATTEAFADPASMPNTYKVIFEGHYFSQEIGTGPAIGLEFILYNSTHDWDITDEVSLYDPDPDSTVPLAPYTKETAILDKDGNFTAWWKVWDKEDLSLGCYKVNVTDDNDLFAQIDICVCEERIYITPRKTKFDRGDTVQFDIKNDFFYEGSYMKIWDPIDNLYWVTQTYEEVNEEWVKVETLYTVPYYAQTSGGNPMTLAPDAPMGEWFWAFYTFEDKQLVNGTFEVGKSATAILSEQLGKLSGDMSALTDQIDDVTDDIGDLSGEIGDVITDVEGMIDDITADLAEDLAKVATDTEAALSEFEDEVTDSIGDIAAAQNALQSELEDMGQDTAAAKQAAEDAKQGTQGLTTLVYGAIAASLIAALAAVVSLMQISKKIA